MGRPPLGDRPLTGAQRQARLRERQQAQQALAQEALEFVRTLRPDAVPPRRALAELQKRIEAAAQD